MRNSLADFLAEMRVANACRTAIVGIGNTLNGDDAAGPLVAQALCALTGSRASRSDITPAAESAPATESAPAAVAIFDAGPSPEAFTGPLRRFAPELILLVDAAELGEAPGTVRWFDWSQAGGLSASTHTLPPSLVAGFLVRELGCRVALIGIQPQRLDLDGGVSDPVRKAVAQVVRGLATLF